MPYIKSERRAELFETYLHKEDKSDNVESAGELNWLITMLCQEYLKTKGESYQTYCEIEGVLSHASKELYRRRTAKYEDKKILQNGDVF